MRKAIIAIATVALSVCLALFGLPAFAQTRVAAMIPNQPLARIAAQQIIANSGLPKETLPDGATNAVTAGRDAVNAYRYAHQQLYRDGWYRGISTDHDVLLQALVDALVKEGYTTKYLSLDYQSKEVLAKFFADSRAVEDSWK